MAKPGRKPTFTSAEEIQTKVDQYFKDCLGTPFLDDDGRPMRDKFGEIIMMDARPPTVTGLALALGFHSRQSLLNYQAKKEFMDTITRAKMRVEEYCETRLFDRDGQRGAEFNLRYNFRWAQEEKSGWNEDSASGVVMIPEVGASDG